MPLLILLLPLAEIAAFIVVGKAIGVAATLALVVASSAIGAIMLRDAGLMTLLRLEQRRDDPAAILREGGARMVAGLLLLVPGFLTDLAALAVLTPAIRGPILRSSVFRRDSGTRSEAGPTIVEGDFRRLDQDT
jgi:UPF0716 protein FxsA